MVLGVERLRATHGLLHKVIVNDALLQVPLNSEAQEVRQLVFVSEVEQTDRPIDVTVEDVHQLSFKLFHRLEEVLVLLVVFAQPVVEKEFVDKIQLRVWPSLLLLLFNHGL